MKLAVSVDTVQLVYAVNLDTPADTPADTTVGIMVALETDYPQITLAVVAINLVLPARLTLYLALNLKLKLSLLL